jgi:hypothetical protein
MRILMLVLVLTGTASGADIYDEGSNRIGRTEERQGRIEVYDTQSNRIGGGVRQPDGSIEFRRGIGLDSPARRAPTAR